MWYKNGEVFVSQQAIRNDNKESSLPHFLSDSAIEELGYVKVVDVVPTALPTQRVVEGAVELVDGIPTKIYTLADKAVEEVLAEQSAYMESVLQKFTDTTTAYIESKVTAYNVANGLAFKDIDSFTKYAINPLSVHHTIANKFAAYADRVWTTVRNYQATATGIPTDEEFLALLDSVVF